MSAMVELEIKFEDKCYRCNGSSHWSGKDCDRCGSTGLIATTLGQHLLGFLEHQRVRDAAQAAHNSTQPREGNCNERE